MTGHGGHPPAKRRKLDAESPHGDAPAKHQPSPGIERPISPPPTQRKSAALAESALTPAWGFGDVPRTASPSATTGPASPRAERDSKGIESTKYVSAPVQLTRIEDLAPHQNIDTVDLSDILGDPMIKECWNFNYLHDIDFTMQHFDEDVRDMVKVKIVHGFWKSEDENRIRLLETAERYPNISLIPAYLPDPFGTHHSKMLVLFRHDDTAQVIIHTANMIHRDWSNMTQAVWRSPLLPLFPTTPASPDTDAHPIGSAERFKVDFLRYLKAYGNRLKALTESLSAYDFSSVRAAFLGSAPSRVNPAAARPQEQTSFGWLGLQEILSTVPIQPNADASSPPHILIQISSIATLGATPTWLTCLQNALIRSFSPSSTSSGKKDIFSKKQHPKPTFNIIFPTPDEIRTSLDGYGSGASIHIKLQSTQQIKQQEYLHPLFCHWQPFSSPSPSTSTSTATNEKHGEAHRGLAAPHIKTYIRFTDHSHKTIDWAIVTSANLSRQAWGDVVNKKDEVWIQSFEAGVVVWPELCAENSVMVPVFGRDMPGPEDCDGEGECSRKTVMGFRMPYDLPLRAYEAGEGPWCATMQYLEPDWKGQVWAGYGKH